MVYDVRTMVLSPFSHEIVFGTEREGLSIQEVGQYIEIMLKEHKGAWIEIEES